MVYPSVGIAIHTEDVVFMGFHMAAASRKEQVAALCQHSTRCGMAHQMTAFTLSLWLNSVSGSRMLSSFTRPPRRFCAGEKEMTNSSHCFSYLSKIHMLACIYTDRYH